MGEGSQVFRRQGGINEGCRNLTKAAWFSTRRTRDRRQTHAQCDVGNIGFPGGRRGDDSWLRPCGRVRLSLLPSRRRLGLSGRLLLPLLWPMPGERLRPARLLQRQSALRVWSRAARPVLPGLLSLASVIRYSSSRRTPRRLVESFGLHPSGVSTATGRLGSAVSPSADNSPAAFAADASHRV